ncbi:MAG: hypothetical protein OEL20_03580 [Sulfuritalea sp.]|nr:hypothetical protein [Sulfuritalea sp.]
MKSIKLMIALLLLAAGGAGNAWADRGHGHGHGHNHGHVRFGVVIGPFWGGPWHYPPPYYPRYYPQVVVQPPAPQVYIEQPAPPPAPVAVAPANYWYYCAAARGYYPYVKECPGGWQKVLPQPSGQP